MYTLADDGGEKVVEHNLFYRFYRVSLHFFIFEQKRSLSYKQTHTQNTLFSIKAGAAW